MIYSGIKLQTHVVLVQNEAGYRMSTLIEYRDLPPTLGIASTIYIHSSLFRSSQPLNMMHAISYGSLSHLVRDLRRKVWEQTKFAFIESTWPKHCSWVFRYGDYEYTSIEISIRVQIPSLRPEAKPQTQWEAKKHWHNEESQHLLISMRNFFSLSLVPIGNIEF